MLVLVIVLFALCALIAVIISAVALAKSFNDEITINNAEPSSGKKSTNGIPSGKNAYRV